MNLKWYLLIIAVCASVATAIISAAYGISFILVLIKMLLGIIVVIAIDAVTATICRILPEKCANFKSKIFSVSKNEKCFYEKIHIRKWKEKIPEIGHFTGFRKNKIAEPKNPKYLIRFLREICYGELGHSASVFTGFFILFLSLFSPEWLSICMVIAIVNALLNVLPVMVLRYNSYKLLILYNAAIKNQADFNKATVCA